jgi:hypothetical protein
MSEPAPAAAVSWEPLKQLRKNCRSYFRRIVIFHSSFDRLSERLRGRLWGQRQRASPVAFLETCELLLARWRVGEHGTEILILQIERDVSTDYVFHIEKIT